MHVVVLFILYILMRTFLIPVHPVILFEFAVMVCDQWKPQLRFYSKMTPL